jgi:hypothetical protein
MLHTIVPLALALAAAAPIPAALSTLEHVAEAIDDAVVSNDWTKVRVLVRNGERALAELSISSVPVGRDAIRALADAKSDSRLRASLATRRAANRLAAAVVGMYEPLHPTVPTSVMRLDVLLREVALAAVAGNLADARNVFGRAEAVWASISTGPPLAGSRAAHTFSRQLAALEHSIATGLAQAVERSANAALEGVDAIEKVFKSTSHAAR